ncbi:MAG TPA: HDOD domain-containing protein [Verrucomicrobiae bacterium]|jgi:putative nucleotidyltransferase with HDIG domain|nr:HDOD domain-containing protein [Verrucomicrobiae bacterium]
MALPTQPGQKQDKLDAFIDLVHHLPPSPRLLVKLLEVFKQPDPDINEVVKLISHDPSFTVEVLKRCNSAFFAGDKPAENMFEAVSRLGFQEIYQIIMAMFAATAILKPGTGGGAHVDILWRHSVAVAVASGVLATEAGESNAAAFTAGLLHDIGKVVMVSADRDKYAEAVLNSGMFGRPVVVTEKELFGFDHAEVGARLLMRWNFPLNIVAAVLHHHRLEGAESFERIAAIIHLSNMLAHGTGEKLAGTPQGLQNAAVSMAVLQLVPDKITTLLPSMQQGLEKAKATMPG